VIYLQKKNKNQSMFYAGATTNAVVLVIVRQKNWYKKVKP
jgi:hypothetical protein